MGSAGRGPRKFLSVRRQYLIRGCEPIYVWASARANKSGYIGETFRPVGNKILRGPGQQLRRKGNGVSFKEMHCFPVVGAFLQGMEEGDRSPSAGAGEGAPPGQRNSVGPRRGAHLDPALSWTPPGPLPHLGLRQL